MKLHSNRVKLRHLLRSSPPFPCHIKELRLILAFQSRSTTPYNVMNPHVVQLLEDFQRQVSRTMSRGPLLRQIRGFPFCEGWGKFQDGGRHSECSRGKDPPPGEAPLPEFSPP